MSASWAGLRGGGATPCEWVVQQLTHHGPTRHEADLLAVWIALPALALAACGGGGGGDNNPPPPGLRALSASGSVQLSASGLYAFVVNKTASPTVSTDSGSVTIVQVKLANGADVNTVVAEIEVGEDPTSVTASADGTRLFVSNTADNTVSVIDLGTNGEGPYVRLADILVGSQPRGTAELDGKVYVANYGEGTLTVIDIATLSRDSTIPLASGDLRVPNPFALAALPDGRLWVTDFFARAIPGKPIDEVEVFDDGREGRVAILQDDTITAITALAPLADAGFDADRTAFDTANGAVNDSFKAPDGVDPTQVPQGALFNQLHSIAYDESGERVYVASIGGQPAPPVRFNVNVQALIGVLDGNSGASQPSLHRNLNRLIADNFVNEPEPVPPFVSSNLARLDRAFAADTTSIVIKNRLAALVSRAGSFLMKAQIGADGVLTLATDDRGAILRIPVANIPGGVALSADGERAYVASELIGQLTVVDFANGTVIATVDTASTPDEDAERRVLLGQLKFFTGMGIPADVTASQDPREVDTLRHRNMQSDNNWSSCASCHPFGQSDTLTWSFATGPRQTISLDGFFAPGSTIEDGLSTTDQKISNWNAERQGSTEFNNNSRNVQGGHGFTPQALATIDAGLLANQVPDAGLVFNGGQRLGISNALDFETEWIASLRAPRRPTNLDEALVAEGRLLFGTNCASCHGGTKWTTSDRVVDSVLWPDPAFNSAGVLLTANLFSPAATITAAFDSDDNGSFETPIIDTTVPNSTLDLTNPVELRGTGGLIGKSSVGVAGSFAMPSLFNIVNTAPYGHHGRARTLEDIFEPISNDGLEHPTFGLLPAELAAVLEFVRAIDEDQPIFP